MENESTTSARGPGRALARGGISVLGLRGVAIVFGFATSLLLADGLGVAEFGIYNYALSWTTALAALASLRANVLVLRAIPSYTEKEDWGGLRGLLSFAYRVVAASAFSLIIVGVAAAWWNNNPTLEFATFVCALLMLPALALTQVDQSVLENRGEIFTARAPDPLIRQGGLLAFLVVAGFVGSGLLAKHAMAAHLAAACCAFVATHAFVRRSTPTGLRSAAPLPVDRAWARPLVPLALTGFIMALNAHASTMLLGALRPPQDVGIFSAVNRYAVLLSYVLVAVNVPLAPMIAKHYAKGDLDSIQRIATRASLAVVAITVPAGVGMLVFSRELLSLFGAEFVVGSDALRVMVVAQLISTIAGSVGVVLNMTGHERENALGAFVALAANIALAVILIPRHGPMGAAIAAAGGMVIWNLLLVVLLRTRVGIWSTAIHAIVHPRKSGH